MTPLEFLAAMVLLTLAARTGSEVLVRRRRWRLMKLARQWEMHYSPRDHFNLADRVAAEFPIPGVADVRVVDLFYCLRGESYVYLFCVEFTVGVTRSKHRRWRIATFTDPRDRAIQPARLRLTLAPQTLGVLEQYRVLYEQVEKESASPAREEADEVS
ncbi:MAG: hypothetical protein ACREJC_04575 [Tepidisphaeraceae bacterium]